MFGALVRESFCNGRDAGRLSDLFASARIIGLGEATHGTHEIFAIKHQLIEFLVEHHSFTIFAIEAIILPSEKINEYVQGGDADEFDAMVFLNRTTESRLLPISKQGRSL